MQRKKHYGFKFNARVVRQVAEKLSAMTPAKSRNIYSIGSQNERWDSAWALGWDIDGRW